MASIRMVAEDEAVGRLKVVSKEIMEQFGIDFVPHLYEVMATNPAYLEASWNKVRAIMFASGKLDRLTKEIRPSPSLRSKVDPYATSQSRVAA